MKNKKFYEHLVKKLGITDAILKSRISTIKKRLHGAAVLIGDTTSTSNATPLPSTRIQGINQCIHVSIGILFSGKASDTDIDAELNSIKEIPEFDKCDSTDVAAAAILKYVLDYLGRTQEDDPSTRQQIDEEVKTVVDTFDQINWFLNEDAIKKLGLGTKSGKKA
ncbi:MAG: hypothetical protein NTX45_30010 [Proteobacteria bacterium]|nr:hypothetical protein [Pseudomonadota bacterium]